MSFISHHHPSAVWHRLREFLVQDEFTATVIFFLFAIIIAVALFAPPAFMQ